MLAWWVGGSEKVTELVYVIYEWSLTNMMFDVLLVNIELWNILKENFATL